MNVDPASPSLDSTAKIASRVQACIDLRRYDEAIRVAAQGLATAPRDLRLLCLSALALIRLDRHTEAVTTAEQAIEADPSDDWPHRLHAIALSNLARKRKGRARVAAARDAVRAADEAVRIAPTSHLSFVVLADARLAASDTAGADAAARRAIELAPDSADVWVCRSQIALRAKDYPAAEDAARTALSLAPDNFAAHNNLGAALLARNKRKDAAHAFLTAGQLQPTSAVAQRNISLTGLRGPHLVVLLGSLPLLFIPGLGVVLYLTVAIGGNVLLRRSQRIRAWAAERAVRIGAKSSRGPSPTSVADRDHAPRHPTAPKPVISHYEIRTPLLVIADLIAAVISVFVAIAVALPQPDGGSRLSFLPIIVVFGAVDLFLAHLTRKRVRLARRTRRGTI